MNVRKERGDTIMARRPTTEVSILEILLSLIIVAVVIALSLYFWYIATHDQPPNDGPVTQAAGDQLT